MAIMLYRPPYFGARWETKAALKRRAKKIVQAPGVVDKLAKTAVVALNELPFVVQTIESCAGHATTRGPYGGADAPCGPFLEILYEKSPKAERFHEQLVKLFDSSRDNTKRLALDQNLVRAAAGDTGVLCVNCGDRVRDCSCPTSNNYKLMLADARRALRVQKDVSYYAELRPLTLMAIKRFWTGVEATVVAAARGTSDSFESVERPHPRTCGHDRSERRA